MRARPLVIWSLALTAPVLTLLVGVARDLFPLGWPGEWTWSRVPARFGADPVLVLIALIVLGLFVGLAALGTRLMATGGMLRRLALVSTLVAAGIALQLALLAAAPSGFGLEKWVLATYWPGSNGYYTIAHDGMPEGPARFWTAYPDWIQDQDALHIGTHPPGLMLGWRLVLTTLRQQPRLASVIVASAPSSVRQCFVQIGQLKTLGAAERATLVLVSFLTLCGSVLTVVPLYALARASLGAQAAWAAACFWPLVPSAVLFGPAADTAFPLLATAALALASRARPGAAVLAGVVLALGMFLTLAFLAVGLVVALVLLGDPTRPMRCRLMRISLVGLGFVVPTLLGWLISGANPLVIWWWNQRHHARFYAEYPRSYLAWQVLNPVEFAVGVGLPVAVLAALGLRSAGRAAWATVLVLALLQLTGRNLSEVARIWLPLMPPVCLAAGAGWERIGGRVGLLALALALVGLQTVGLQALVQVVYGVDLAGAP